MEKKERLGWKVKGLRGSVRAGHWSELGRCFTLKRVKENSFDGHIRWAGCGLMISQVSREKGEKGFCRLECGLDSLMSYPVSKQRREKGCLFRGCSSFGGCEKEKAFEGKHEKAVTAATRLESIT